MTGEAVETSLVRIQGQIRELELALKLGDRESAQKIEFATARIEHLTDQFAEQHRNGEQAITAVREDLTKRLDKLSDRVFGDNEFSLDKRVVTLERFRWALVGALAVGTALSGALGALVSHAFK